MTEIRDILIHLADVAHFQVEVPGPTSNFRFRCATESKILPKMAIDGH